MTAPVRRVAAYGFFGIGNLGNEASLSALFGYLRTNHPEVELSCFAVGADNVTRDHGVPAKQLMTYARLGIGGGPWTKFVKGLSRIWDVPRTFAMLGAVDLVIVPGTGALETQLGVPAWGLPFWLFVLSIAARLRRRQVALVSVGAQYATHPLTRLFYRWTVRLASSCSFRDDTSREVVRRMGVRNRLGPVYPDLAFSLPTPPPEPTRLGHVVIGVMAYYGRADDPVRGAGVRQRYVVQMAEFVTSLVQQGKSVTLVIGDLADHDVALEIQSAFRAGQPDHADRLTVSDATSMADLLLEMSTAEVVVASRFHNLIAALKLAKPTVSLGYAQKNADLLSRFGLGEFTQGMDDFDPELLTRQLKEAQSEGERRESVIRLALVTVVEQLDVQFGQLSSKYFDSTHVVEGVAR
jgi:polysaccharide pyruvyl transferase WcaK-like protein